MTIDITTLINGPPGEDPREGFKERLLKFVQTHEMTHPHLFKPREVAMSDKRSAISEGTERHEGYSKYDAPVRILDAIWNHAEYHRPCGSFVTAVLENNLMEALGRADGSSKAALFEIVRYVRWEIPGDCHGSVEKVRAWLVPEQPQPDIDFCSKCHEHTSYGFDWENEEWLSVCCGARIPELP